MMFRYKYILVVLLFLSVLIIIDSSRFADPDLFCHLYSGREIFEKGQVHKTDTHSFSVYGDPWIDYEWMARYIFFILYKYLGSPGLVALRIVISLLIFLLIYRISERMTESSFFSIITLLLGVTVSYRYFLFRTQLFTFLFLSILMFILYRYGKEGNIRAVLILPLFFLIWSNLHAGFPLGLFIFGIFVFSLMIGRLLKGRWDFSEYPINLRTISFLLLIFLGSLLVTLVNPYGIDLWKGIAKTLFGTFTPEISEWKPALQYPFFRLFWFYLFIFLYAVSFNISRKKRMFDLLLFLIMAYLSITKVRFVPITAIILMPSLSFYLKETFGGIISEERRFPIFPYSRQVVSFFIILVLLSVPILTKIIQGDIHLNGRIYKTDFYQPVAPVKLMKGNGFLGNIMNEYDWGGYIHWELPDCKIFVDGRSDTVYSHEIINRWSYFVNGEEGWKSILEESGADAILIRTSHLVNDILKKLDGWQVIYFDDIASLYMNLESSRNKDFLKKWLNDSLLIEKKSFNDYIL